MMSQKNKFVKLWDLVPFSNRASLKMGPCKKTTCVNCIVIYSQNKKDESLIVSH